jgi:Holliday junction resolvasome RuvABC endonuclease subunit
MILALDLGTWTGAVRGFAGERPVCMTWRMPGGGREDIGAFADAFDRELTEALDDPNQSPVTLIVFEAPFLGRKIARNMHTARRLLWMPGAVEMHAHRREIPVFECNMGTVRKGFLGKGRAEKYEIVAGAKARGFEVENHHEADAAACWWYAVICNHPHLADRYDPLMQGAR